MYDQCFIELALQLGNQSPAGNSWIDVSTADYFIFQSEFAFLKLRRRQSYPQTFAEVINQTLYFGYGNRRTGHDIAHDLLDRVPEHFFYDEEFLYGRIDLASRSLRIQRDTVCTLPLFFFCQDDKAVLSNQFDRVCELSPSAMLTPNRRVIAKIIEGYTETNYTIVNQVKILYDRARLDWQPGKQAITQANDSIIKQIMIGQRDGDARQFRPAIESTLDAYIQRYATEPGQNPAAELSGGVDSSLICWRLAYNNTPFIAGGLIFPGDYTKTQIERLNDLKSAYQIDGLRVAMEPQDYRQAPHGNFFEAGKLVPFHHVAKIYSNSFAPLIQAFARQGATVVFNGQGGDELSENIPLEVLQAHKDAEEFMPQQDLDELPVWINNDVFTDFAHTAYRQVHSAGIPWPPVSRSVSTLPASSNNDYLSYNIWPVAPLADVQLYQFCQSLPIRYRYDRKLVYAYMKARRMPPSILRGKTEDFGTFFSESVQRNLRPAFERLMSGSVLAKAGIIDIDKLDAEWDRCATLDLDSRLGPLYRIFQVMVIETNLQALGMSL